MSVANVVNWKKEKVGQVDLSPEVFDVEVKNEVLHSVVRWQLACRRQGNAMTKTKGLVSGGGKKPFKQKGTGNARQGSTRSPLMPGGGTIFGPQPRSYAYVLPKKMRRLGLAMALSHLNKEGKLLVIDQMKADGKTSDLNKKLAALGLKKALLVDSQYNDLFGRASKNLPKFKYFGVEGLNVYDLLKYDQVVISKDSVASIVGRCTLEND
jgi:large subunit ribosomal protein L4